MANEPRVLLFEDDQVLRRLFSLRLESRGCTVDAHEDPEQVMSGDDLRARLQTYDAIWTDGTMLRMHGKEAAHTARENGFLGPVVLCSGNSLDDYKDVQRPDYVAGNWRGPLFDIIYPKPFLDFERAIADLKSASVNQPKDIYTT